ncbi:lipopolysaccharide biosynthesis protein [Georgenia deserti]|uniref:Lipopolysaccharide biosynthesis protein n=1 Tax=Georgenia deserti TaxID=2093781 RepID=A0ABW4L175_9MICO
MAEPRPQSIGATAVRSTRWVILEKWLGRTVSLVVFAILARILTPEAYGVVMLANVFTVILTSVVQQGFAKTIVQRPKISAVDIDTTFWTSLLLGIAIYAALFFASPLIAAGYDEPILTWILRALGINVVVMAIASVQVGLLERSFDFRALAVRQVGGIVAGGSLGIGVAVLGGGPWALVAQMLGTSVIGCAILWIRSSWRPRFKFSLASLRDLWALNMFILGSEVISATSNQLDNLIVGTFFGTTALGYYYVALRAANIVVELVTAVVGRVSFSTFARLQYDRSRIHRAFSLMTLGTSMSSLPVLAFLAVAAPEAITLIFGDKWEPSAPLLTVLAVAFSLSVVTRADRVVLLALGHTAAGFRMSLTRQGLGAALLFAAVPFGVMAIPWARVARALITWPMRMYSLKKYTGMGLHVYGGPFLRVGLPVALAAGLTVATRPLLDEMTSLPRLLTLACIFAAACAVTLLLLARPQLREARSVLGSARRPGGPPNQRSTEREHRSAAQDRAPADQDEA